MEDQDLGLALFLPSAKAASSLGAVFCAGLYLGFYPRPHGLLSPPAIRTLASCVLYAFSPALLFSTFGRTLTPALLRDAFSAALWCVIHIGVSLAVALPARALARPPPELSGAFMLACTWGNAMSLPLLLLTSLTARCARTRAPLGGR